MAQAQCKNRRLKKKLIYISSRIPDYPRPFVKAKRNSQTYIKILQDLFENPTTKGLYNRLRICLYGDEGLGKTSIISYLCSEEKPINMYVYWLDGKRLIEDNYDEREMIIEFHNLKKINEEKNLLIVIDGYEEDESFLERFTSILGKGICIVTSRNIYPNNFSLIELNQWNESDINSYWHMSTDNVNVKITYQEFNELAVMLHYHPRSIGKLKNIILKHRFDYEKAKSETKKFLTGI